MYIGNHDHMTCSLCKFVPTGRNRHHKHTVRLCIEIESYNRESEITSFNVKFVLNRPPLSKHKCESIYDADLSVSVAQVYLILSSNAKLTQMHVAGYLYIPTTKRHY